MSHMKESCHMNASCHINEPRHINELFSKVSQPLDVHKILEEYTFENLWKNGRGKTGKKNQIAGKFFLRIFQRVHVLIVQCLGSICQSLGLSVQGSGFRFREFVPVSVSSSCWFKGLKCKGLWFKVQVSTSSWFSQGLSCRVQNLRFELQGSESRG